MVLGDIANVRTGDKGDTCQIAVIARDPADFDRLVLGLTVDRVREHLRAQAEVPITRYELPSLGALNFVIEGILRGGVTRSLSLDPHGKTMGAQLLMLEMKP